MRAMAIGGYTQRASVVNRVDLLRGPSDEEEDEVITQCTKQVEDRYGTDSIRSSATSASRAVSGSTAMRLTTSPAARRSIAQST